ncbi:MAG: SUF system NifU family Fe-S cluster assembly protein [Candidatus Caccosoma sp.]|nr:SUF system NifU family Fe-S cluster assembly protein [Candidatus Caccosoma sp.]
MLSLNDPMIKREIIMDHYENPRNKGLVDDPRYLKINMNSESCIDDIDIQILVENNIIKDFRFDGVGCTISTASTSILSELVINESVEKAYEIIKEYDNMIKELPYDEMLLQEAVVFKDVSKQANRIKCAMIGFNGLLELLNSLKAGE